MTELALCRSLLFLPASNPRAIEKARGLPADMIILDLEDAVRDEDKAGAREAAVAAIREGFGDRPVAIRINAVGSPHHGADMVSVRGSGAAFLVLPKAESAKDVHDTHSVSQHPIISMIETAKGVMAAPAIAAASAGLIAGTNDLAADLGIPASVPGRTGLSYALQQIVLTARAAGIPAFDGVYNRLEDQDGLAAEAREGRSFGFDGKSVIHPAQIETVNRLLGPDEAELADARGLIEASTGGAERYRGRMIEDLHVAQARRLIAKARG